MTREEQLQCVADNCDAFKNALLACASKIPPNWLNSKLTLSQKDVVFSLQCGSILCRVGEYTRHGYRFILSNDNIHKIVNARTVYALVNRGLLEWTASGRTLCLTEDGKTWSAR